MQSFFSSHFFSLLLLLLFSFQPLQAHQAQGEIEEPKSGLAWNIELQGPSLPSIHWVSGDEALIARYELQSSEDGIHFQTLEIFAAKGSAASYFFIDKKRLASGAQRSYRLLALSEEGQVEAVLSERYTTESI